jgi:hypothetical protein
MKKLFLLLALLFSISFYAQNEVKITTKKCIPKKGYHLKLVKVFDDSRCPEGVSCIWAGEVSATFQVYKDKKLVEEKTLVFNSKNAEENKNLFQNYYSKKIKSIGVIPYPKEGVDVKTNQQFVRVTFEN